MNVAELLVRCLENEGVKHVFGIPGEETLALNAALAESDKIKFILTRHEQGAAFMADVYGRLSSYPGVCLATLGPRATNLITGVADAQIDRAPLVAITGQVGLERSHKESHQYMDIVLMFGPVTKWRTRVSAAESIAELVRPASPASKRLAASSGGTAYRRRTRTWRRACLTRSASSRSRQRDCSVRVRSSRTSRSSRRPIWSSPSVTTSSSGPRRCGIPSATR